MRRFFVLVVSAAGIFLAMRKITERAGPGIRKHCSERCEQMLARMPGSFPPNRMMADLEALTEQSVRILEVLEQRQEAEGPQQ